MIGPRGSLGTEPSGPTPPQTTRWVIQTVDRFLCRLVSLFLTQELLKELYVLIETHQRGLTSTTLYRLEKRQI